MVPHTAQGSDRIHPIFGTGRVSRSAPRQRMRAGEHFCAGDKRSAFDRRFQCPLVDDDLRNDKRHRRRQRRLAGLPYVLRACGTSRARHCPGAGSSQCDVPLQPFERVLVQRPAQAQMTAADSRTTNANARPAPRTPQSKKLSRNGLPRARLLIVKKLDFEEVFSLQRMQQAPASRLRRGGLFLLLYVGVLSISTVGVVGIRPAARFLRVPVVQYGPQNVRAVH